MKRLLMSALAASIVLVAQSNAYADPAEHQEIAITRSASSSETLTGQLTKNVYRYVEREIVEIIQVPYVVTVPYQVTETYYVDERLCEYINRRVCSPGHPRQVCRAERVCTRPTPGHPPQCSIRQICHNVPGEPVCRIERDYVCRIVRVPHTRIVTRYRQETRYRPEERRRIVTDKIFERQWGVNVAVVFPAEAELRGNEHETLLVHLRGEEGNPAADVTVESPIYNYRVVGQTPSEDGTLIQTQLELVAKYQPEDLGEKTISGLIMARNSNGRHQVQFEDTGVVARTTTEYLVQVADKDTGRWVFEGKAHGAFGNRLVVVPVTSEIASDHDHVVRLSVAREGMVISGPVNFYKEAHQMGQLNPAPYVDPNGVREFTIEGKQGAAQLVFLDATPADAKVDTTYKIKLKRKLWKFLWKVTTAEATFNRKQLQANADGRISVPLNAFPGLTADELSDYFEAGDQVIVQVDVKRVSPRLGGASPVRFEKEAKVRIAK